MANQRNPFAISIYNQEGVRRGISAISIIQKISKSIKVEGVAAQAVASINNNLRAKLEEAMDYKTQVYMKNP